jgi:hypothetical protein
VAQAGDQAGGLELAELALLHHVDDDGVVGLATQQEGHDAVLAGLGVLPHALVTVDPHAAERTQGV